MFQSINFCSKKACKLTLVCHSSNSIQPIITVQSWCDSVSMKCAVIAIYPSFTIDVQASVVMQIAGAFSMRFLHFLQAYCNVLVANFPKEFCALAMCTRDSAFRRTCGSQVLQPFAEHDNLWLSVSPTVRPAFVLGLSDVLFLTLHNQPSLELPVELLYFVITQMFVIRC